MAVLDESETELWEQFVHNKCRDSHEKLLRIYLPRARLIAAQIYRRFRIPELDWSDYTQNATYGLLEAMQRYVPARGIPFLAFSQPRIRGAVFNGLRTFIAEHKHQVKLNEKNYQERLDSITSVETEDSIQVFANAVSGLALGYLLDYSAVYNHNEHHHETSKYAQEQQTEELLRQVFQCLTDKEQNVLTMHYYNQLPFNEIAKVMEVSKGRVSQLHRRGLERLREKFSQSGYQAKDF